MATEFKMVAYIALPSSGFSGYQSEQNLLPFVFFAYALQLVVPNRSCRYFALENEFGYSLEPRLVDGHMEKKLANVQEAMYSLVAPRELMTVTSGYGASCIFTDGSLIEGRRALLFMKWV
jgi:hypothetical protein